MARKAEYPKSLTLMVGAEVKTWIEQESERRNISQGDLVRELLDIGLAQSNGPVHTIR